MMEELYGFMQGIDVVHEVPVSLTGCAEKK